MSDKRLTDDEITDAVLKLLAEAEDAPEVMRQVTEVYCDYCWRRLDGERCFCAPCYDE